MLFLRINLKWWMLFRVDPLFGHHPSSTPSMIIRKLEGSFANTSKTQPTGTNMKILTKETVNSYISLLPIPSHFPPLPIPTPTPTTETKSKSKHQKPKKHKKMAASSFPLAPKSS